MGGLGEPEDHFLNFHGREKDLHYSCGCFIIIDLMTQHHPPYHNKLEDDEPGGGRRLFCLA